MFKTVAERKQFAITHYESLASEAFIIVDACPISDRSADTGHDIEILDARCVLAIREFNKLNALITGRFTWESK